MKCIYCGNNNPTDAKFCRECGKIIPSLPSIALRRILGGLIGGGISGIIMMLLNGFFKENEAWSGALMSYCVPFSPFLPWFGWLLPLISYYIYGSLLEILIGIGIGITERSKLKIRYGVILGLSGGIVRGIIISIIPLFYVTHISLSDELYVKLYWILRGIEGIIIGGFIGWGIGIVEKNVKHSIGWGSLFGMIGYLFIQYLLRDPEQFNFWQFICCEAMLGGFIGCGLLLATGGKKK